MTSIDFDLRQLEIFCKVVELESFSKAADAVYLAQASVSERIATLEKMVGTKLLDRLGRKIVPTKAGELLYKHAILLLEMKRTACLEIETFLGLKQGEIHIGGSTIPGEYILPEIIGRFHENNPLVSIILNIADSSEIETRVLEGGLELGIIGFKSSDKNLLSYELWQDELVLAVPSNHRWAKKNIVSIQEIAEEPFIFREVGSGTLKIMEEYFKGVTTKDSDAFHVVARFGSSTAVKRGIMSGLGVSIISSRAIDMEVKAGLIHSLRIKGLKMSRKFYLIRDKRRIASPLCQALYDFLIANSKSNKR